MAVSACHHHREGEFFGVCLCVIEKYWNTNQVMEVGRGGVKEGKDERAEARKPSQRL